MERIDVLERSIGELLAALDSGDITSVALTCAYLNRIGYYDRTGTCLNALVALNPDCLVDAAASDQRRREGRARPLEGIPYTVKDSYKVRGMTVASGSPALTELVATGDADAVTRLRAAGAVLIGRTNMPPMAAGGIQPGAYGYALSPYHPDYITGAYGSGSSNGSGTATAASFSAFGMGEETVSSGRSPASNNALVAYTPSRGVLSIRGNWPLRPTCDVVVPHTRSVADLTVLLDVLVGEDPEREGDFWREQNAVELPDPQTVFSFPISRARPARLDGVRIGVPKMYIGEDDVPVEPPVIRPTVRLLWDRAADDLRALGAEVVECDFPVVSNYEVDRPGAHGLPERGLVPPTWRQLEGGPITAMAFDKFLRVNADPTLNTWADVDGDTVFPTEDAPVPVWITRARGGFDWTRLAELVKQGLPETYDELPGFAQLLQGLEAARKADFEDWLTEQNLDLVVFPAAGDVGRDDLFTRHEAMVDACRNGVVYSNGNRVIRHLGIPTVTVPMGFMADIQMPVGLTFAGPAYSDDRLIDYAGAYERATKRREPPFLTPTLPSNQVTVRTGDQEPDGSLDTSVDIDRDDRSWLVTARVGVPDAQVWADGIALLPVDDEPGSYRGRISISRNRLTDDVLLVALAGRQARYWTHTLPLEPEPDEV